MTGQPEQPDPYEAKEKFGAMVLEAAGVTPPEDLARLYRIIAGERFISKLVDAKCMITRIPEGPVAKRNTAPPTEQ